MLNPPDETKKDNIASRKNKLDNWDALLDRYSNAADELTARISAPERSEWIIKFFGNNAFLIYISNQLKNLNTIFLESTGEINESSVMMSKFNDIYKETLGTDATCISEVNSLLRVIQKVRRRMPDELSNVIDKITSEISAVDNEFKMSIESIQFKDYPDLIAAMLLVKVINSKNFVNQFRTSYEMSRENAGLFKWSNGMAAMLRPWSFFSQPQSATPERIIRYVCNNPESRSFETLKLMISNDWAENKIIFNNANNSNPPAAASSSYSSMSKKN